MDISVLNKFPIWLIVTIILWTMFWKGLALWKSAQLGHKKWFIALLALNTLGILEIVYIYFIAKKYRVERVEEVEK